MYCSYIQLIVVNFVKCNYHVIVSKLKSQFFVFLYPYPLWRQEFVVDILHTKDIDDIIISCQYIQDGDTPLHIAARNEQVDMLILLLQHSSVVDLSVMKNNVSETVETVYSISRCIYNQIQSLLSLYCFQYSYFFYFSLSCRFSQFTWISFL